MRNNAPRRSSLRARRGNASVVAVSLTAMVGFSALAVDLGFARTEQGQLQGVVEAAAEAGAMGFLYNYPDSSPIASGALAAASIAGLNEVSRTSVSVADSQVSFGIYDGGSYTEVCTGDAPGGCDAQLGDINAVQVVDQEGGLPIFFGAVFGRNDQTVGARATAIIESGGICNVPCMLPWAVPDCQMALGADDDPTDDDISWILDDDGNPAVQSRQLIMNPAADDTMGWYVPKDVSNNADANSVSSLLQGDCTDLDDGDVDVGEELGASTGAIDNGMQLTGNLLNNEEINLGGGLKVQAADLQPGLGTWWTSNYATNETVYDAFGDLGAWDEDMGDPSWGPLQDDDGNFESDLLVPDGSPSGCVASLDGDYCEDPKDNGIPGGWGTVLEGPAAVFCASDTTLQSEYCDGTNPDWKDDAEICGFLWMVVYDASHGGEKNIQARIDATREFRIEGAEYGCTNYGVVSSGTKLVVEY